VRRKVHACSSTDEDIKTDLDNEPVHVSSLEDSGDLNVLRVHNAIKAPVVDIADWEGPPPLQSKDVVSKRKRNVSDEASSVVKKRKTRAKQSREVKGEVDEGTNVTDPMGSNDNVNDDDEGMSSCRVVVKEPEVEVQGDEGDEAEAGSTGGKLNLKMKLNSPRKRKGKNVQKGKNKEALGSEVENVEPVKKAAKGKQVSKRALHCIFDQCRRGIDADWWCRND
jgi:hypothetical protein